MAESSKMVDSSPAADHPSEKRYTVADILELVRIKRQKMIDDNQHQNREETPRQEYDKMPRPPIPPLPCGSKLVYMGNLSPSIQENHVIEFFKDVGKIDWVEFMGEGEGFLGFGHVRFKTYAAGRKALKRNGEKLLDRPVELIASEERTVFDIITPSREDKYLFMGNLNPDIKEEDIVEFFKDAGKVRSVRLIYEDDQFLGNAHVEFGSSKVAHKALRCYGQMLHGYYVELVLATKESVWYSYTPSSKTPRGYGMGRMPGHGPTLGPFCCNCKLPRFESEAGKGKSYHM